MATLSTIIVKLAPAKVIANFHLYKSEEVYRILEMGKYRVLPAFTAYDAEGEYGAEEAFSLTNNPSRHQEREEKYGRHRSISVGDVVEVNGVNFVCDDFGWIELD